MNSFKEILSYGIDKGCLDFFEAKVMRLWNFESLRVIAAVIDGFHATTSATMVHHLNLYVKTILIQFLWFRLISIDMEQAIATIDFWLMYGKVIVGFKVSENELKRHASSTFVPRQGELPVMFFGLVITEISHHIDSSTSCTSV